MSAVPFTAADVAYVRAEFVPLEDLCERHGRSAAEVRHEIERGRLPRPSYVLEDGLEMVPADFFVLAHEAGGADRLHDAFVRRYEDAARAEPEPLAVAEEEWQAYLSGEYGVCLRRVTPETIVRKSALVLRIERLLDEADADAPEWRSRLRAAVDELDELERPFAPHYDARRFGGPSSRDRLITAARARYPSVFAYAPA